MTAPRAWTLAIICLVNGFWAFSFGLEVPLASLWLRDHGLSDTLIGLNTGSYYLGILLAAGAVPWMMTRSARGCATSGMVVSGLTVALFPWAGGIIGWFALRGLNGVAGALSLVPMETLVNQNSPNGRRARDFAFYALAVAIGMAVGAWAGLQLYPLAPRLAFVLGGMISVLASGITWLGLEWPKPAVEESCSFSLDWQHNFLSFGTAWSQGFLEGGLAAFLPLYLLAIGYSEGDVSWLLGGTLLGVILFQIPAGWLADRLNPTGVLAVCCLTVAGGMACLPFCFDTAGLAILLFMVGACVGALYPLGLARLGQNLPSAALPRANAWYLAMNCVGSLTGPVVAGAAMDFLGQGALFGVGVVAVLLVMIAWLVLQLSSALGKLPGESPMAKMPVPEDIRAA
jgi:MFS family permease